MCAAGDDLGSAGVRFQLPTLFTMLITSLFVTCFSLYLHFRHASRIHSIHTIHGRYEHKYAPRVWHEIVGLSILWLLWLVGAAVATVSDF